MTKYLVANNPRLGFYEEKVIVAKSFRDARKRFSEIVKKKHRYGLRPDDFRARKWKGHI